MVPKIFRDLSALGKLSDEINTSGIFGSFVLSVKAKSYKAWHIASILANIGRFYTIDELSVWSNYANSTFVCLIVHLTNFPA